METKVSFVARFFEKFIEIIAAGLATALSAYLITHLGGLLSAATPAPAAVQVDPATATMAKSLPAQPVAPVAAAATVEPRPAPQPDVDASAARKTGKTARAVPPRQDSKTAASVARGDRSVEARSVEAKSVEALARAALANVDADQSAPAAAPPRQADPQPAQAQIAVSAVQPQSVTVPEPQPPRAAVPIETSAPLPPPPPDQGHGLLAALKRMPDLLRPDPPASVGEAIRPPMPVGTATGD